MPAEADRERQRLAAAAVGGLVADVRQALWVAGLPASALVLEITETSLATRTWTW